MTMQNQLVDRPKLCTFLALGMVTNWSQKLVTKDQDQDHSEKIISWEDKDQDQ